MNRTFYYTTEQEKNYPTFLNFLHEYSQRNPEEITEISYMQKINRNDKKFSFLSVYHLNRVTLICYTGEETNYLSFTGKIGDIPIALTGLEKLTGTFFVPISLERRIKNE